MPDFLLFSIVGSVVLTVLLNLLPRLFPQQAERAGRALDERLRSESDDTSARPEVGPRVRVWFPWRTMLAVSIGLTVLLNLPALFR